MNDDDPRHVHVWVWQDSPLDPLVGVDACRCGETRTSTRKKPYRGTLIDRHIVGRDD